MIAIADIASQELRRWSPRYDTEENVGLVVDSVTSAVVDQPQTIPSVTLVKMAVGALITTRAFVDGLLDVHASRLP